MAFWDDWDFSFDIDWELDWTIVGVSVALWALMGLILFKMPFAFGSMEGVKLLGMPWNVAKIVVWVLSLPCSYILSMILLSRQGD